MEESSINKKGVLIIAMAALASGLFAQNTRPEAVKGMTLSGPTGLIIVPDAGIGRGDANFEIDTAYGFVWVGDLSFDHLFRTAVSLFQRVQVSGMLNLGEVNGEYLVKSGVLGVKVRFLQKANTSLAAGGDFEIVNGSNSHSGKVWVSGTYTGNFFNMVAVTSATIGWQFLNGGSFSSQFVYGMGFSVGLFPGVFENYLYWIIDFANFSYSVLGARVNARSHGAFNTGIRIHALQNRQFNIVVDVIGTDLLDDGGRGLSASVNGSVAF